MAKTSGKKRSSSKKNQTKIISLICGLIIIGAIVIFGGPELGGLNTPIPLNTSTPSPSLINDEGSLSMYVIDIGQGDAILLAKDGKYVLIDAGESMSPGERESRTAIFTCLDSLGVENLEFLLLTHQDYDHIGSAKDVLSTYNVGIVYDNGVEHTSATYEKLIQYILDENISYEVVRDGDLIISPWSEVKIDVLSPPQDLIMSGSSPDINENSIVLEITYNTVSYILTGDAEDKAESYILSTGAEIDSDILKAGHHGSSSSSTDAFLKAVSPGVIIISVGAENSYGHPHIETLTRYAEYCDFIYRTDLDGDVVVTTDGLVYSVYTEHEHFPDTILVSGDGVHV